MCIFNNIESLSESGSYLSSAEFKSKRKNFKSHEMHSLLDASNGVSLIQHLYSKKFSVGKKMDLVCLEISGKAKNWRAGLFTCLAYLFLRHKADSTARGYTDTLSEPSSLPSLCRLLS